MVYICESLSLSKIIGLYGELFDTVIPASTLNPKKLDHAALNSCWQSLNGVQSSRKQTIWSSCTQKSSCLRTKVNSYTTNLLVNKAF